MIKKKILMMAMAASMILPTNLTAISPITTTVLATEENEDLEFLKLFETGSRQILGSNSAPYVDCYILKNENNNTHYTFQGNVHVTKPIVIEGNQSLTIDLNGYTLSSSSPNTCLPY